MKITAVILLMLVAVCPAQKSAAHKACDDNMNFCWYDDEVMAWGNHWVSEDPSKTLAVGITLRCVKSFHVCIRARSYKNMVNKDLIVTNIELMPVTQWDNSQVRANAENYQWEPCDRQSYIINRLDRTVLMVSSPGPKADTSACTGVLGKPRTIVYKLSQ